MKILRVFVERTAYTPDDDYVLIGRPSFFMPENVDEVHISVVFTWHKKEAEFLLKLYSAIYPVVKIGGPAYCSDNQTFNPGLYVKKGVTFTSRGCIRNCSFCSVHKREGKLKTLPVQRGNIIQDNNFLACSELHQLEVFKMLDHEKDISFNGGLDARLLKTWHVEQLKKLRIKEMFFACDHEKSIPHLERIYKMLSGFNIRKKRCYCLVGFEGDTIENARERLEYVLFLGFMPFAQLFIPEGEKKIPLVGKRNRWTKLQWEFSRPHIMLSNYKKLMA
jgi:hypothetical protein